MNENCNEQTILASMQEYPDVKFKVQNHLLLSLQAGKISQAEMDMFINVIATKSCQDKGWCCGTSNKCSSSEQEGGSNCKVF